MTTDTHLENARRPGRGFESDDQRKAFFARRGGGGGGGGGSGGSSSSTPQQWNPQAGSSGRIPRSVTSPGANPRPIARADGGFGPAETLRPVTASDRLRNQMSRVGQFASSLIPESNDPGPWDLRRHAHEEALRERTARDRIRSLANDLQFLRPTSHVGADDPALSRVIAHGAEFAIPTALGAIGLNKFAEWNRWRKYQKQWPEVSNQITQRLRERNAIYAPELTSPSGSGSGRFLSPADGQRISSGAYHRPGPVQTPRPITRQANQSPYLRNPPPEATARAANPRSINDLSLAEQREYMAWADRVDRTFDAAQAQIARDKAAMRQSLQQIHNPTQSPRLTAHTAARQRADQAARTGIAADPADLRPTGRRPSLYDYMGGDEPSFYQWYHHGGQPRTVPLSENELRTLMPWRIPNRHERHSTATPTHNVIANSPRRPMDDDQRKAMFARGGGRGGGGGGGGGGSASRQNNNAPPQKETPRPITTPQEPAFQPTATNPYQGIHTSAMPAGTHITPGAPAPEGFYSPMTMNDQGHIEGGAGGGGFANWQDPSHDTSPEQQQAHIAAARQRALQAQFEQDAINAGNAAYHATLARHQQEMAHLGYDSASHTGEGEWMAQQAGQAAHERHIQSDPHAGTHQALQTEVERQRQERMHSAAQSAGEQAAQSALHDAHSWGYTREQGYQHAQRAGQQAYEREMARLNSPQGQADRAWNNLSQRPADVQALGRIQNRMAIDSTPPAVRYSANHCQLIANAKNVTRQNTGS